MNFDAVEQIANTVLYEGYMLYPYRPSSTKNRQRWNFGTLYPQAFATAQQPPEPFRLCAECLVAASPQAKLELRLRFLRIAQPPSQERDIECIADAAAISIADLVASGHDRQLPFEAAPLLVGHLYVTASQLDCALHRVHVHLTNLTPADAQQTRESVLPLSFTSAHVLLGIAGGEFVSLLEPPPAHEAAVAECHNQGVFPVLIGERTRRDMMLCSPIILYDYPQVAPESVGDFFDATEMDEMLSLRVLTLTEEEKQEMRQADPRTQSILERTEALPAEHVMKLHGAIRGLRRVQAEEER